MHASKKFVLHGGDSAFADRQKKLFEQLSVAERECNKDRGDRMNTYSDMETELNNSDKLRRLPRAGQKRKLETKQFRGKESIFKRPEAPAPKTTFRSIPDHHRNPHKWVKYTLDDVSGEDMTDRSNAKTAFAFLRELKARKNREGREKDQEEESKMDVEEEESVPDKFTFKPRKNKSKLEFRRPDVEPEKTDGGPVVVTHEEKPIFRSSKVVMPEYVVGQKQKKKERKDRPVVKVDRTKQLKLNHLEEQDEEDE